ncbi:hypothetical protein D3C81_1963460 [compost metagenome]
MQGQNLGDKVRKGFVEDVAGGNIDGDVEILAGPKVGAVILGNALNDVACEFANQIGLLGGANEHFRRNTDIVEFPA